MMSSVASATPPIEVVRGNRLLCSDLVRADLELDLSGLDCTAPNQLDVLWLAEMLSVELRCERTIGVEPGLYEVGMAASLPSSCVGTLGFWPSFN